LGDGDEEGELGALDTRDSDGWSTIPPQDTQLYGHQQGGGAPGVSKTPLRHL
jgi:hypothetical protein